MTESGSRRAVAHDGASWLLVLTAVSSSTPAETHPAHQLSESAMLVERCAGVAWHPDSNSPRTLVTLPPCVGGSTVAAVRWRPVERFTAVNAASRGRSPVPLRERFADCGVRLEKLAARRDRYPPGGTPTTGSERPPEYPSPSPLSPHAPRRCGSCRPLQPRAWSTTRQAMSQLRHAVSPDRTRTSSPAASETNPSAVITARSGRSSSRRRSTAARRRAFTGARHQVSFDDFLDHVWHATTHHPASAGHDSERTAC